MVSRPYLKVTERGIVLSVRIVPGSKRSKIVGLYGDALKIQIASPAVDGKANQSLIDFISKEFGVAKGSIEILKGHQNRSKLLLISGGCQEELEAALDQLTSRD